MASSSISTSSLTISVIIPSYNCAQYLSSALDSVLEQTFPPYEVIVVDDGSTDNTRSIVSRYEGRITYIRQENAGLPGARNTGLRIAQGGVIALLDADDSWLPRKLESQIKYFNDAQVGIVYSDFLVSYSDGTRLDSYLSERPLATEGYILANYVKSRFLFPSTMLFRRKCFEDCGLFDEDMLACEDIELFCKMCAKWKVAKCPDQLVIRREGVGNITTDRSKIARYTVLAFSKVLRSAVNLKASERGTIKAEMALQNWYLGYSLFANGDFREALAPLFHSVRKRHEFWRKAVFVLAACWLRSLRQDRQASASY